PDSKAVPALASSWQASPDRKTWTFTIRAGVKWSDGVPLRAKDFVFSWHRLLAPATASTAAAYLFDIENAEAFNKGQVADFNAVGIKALDDGHLQVKLRQPMAAWHWVTTMVATYPVREDVIRKDPMGWATPGKLVSIGPFTLSSYEPGARVVLARNP